MKPSEWILKQRKHVNCDDPDCSVTSEADIMRGLLKYLDEHCPEVEEKS